MSHAQKYLAVTSAGVSLAQSRLRKTLDHLGQLETPLQAYFGRHRANQVYLDPPRFGRCVARSHVYIIAAGGAGSFGSPALASGMRISDSATSTITPTPTT